MLTIIRWPVIRQTLMVLGLFAVLWFAWSSHAVTLFNGLASPLFFALAAYLFFLATQYKIKAKSSLLVLLILFATCVVFVYARSGEFLPALAIDSHWLVLPLASLLIAEVFREYPRAFEVVQVGAALCIINLLLTLFTMAEWYDNWHYPPIFGHIRHLGLSIGFLTVLLFKKAATTRWVSLFFRLSRILGLAVVFWSGTRAAILAWFFCIAVFIYTDKNWAKTLLIDSAAAIALSLVPNPPLPNIASVLGRSFGVASADAATSFRLAMWQSTLSGLNDIGRLWTGVGGNGFARLQVMHEVVISARGHIQAHNIIVQSICDWGLVGLMLIVSFSYASTLRPIIADSKDNNPTALAAVVYLLITGLFDATLYHLEHLTYLSIALAYLFSQRSTENSKNIEIPAAIVITFLFVSVLIHAQTIDYRIGLYWYFRTE